MQKEILFKRNMYRKHIKGTCLISCFKFAKNKLAKLISSDTEKYCPKSFSDASNFSDIKEEIKQINELKLFDTERRKVIPKKNFVSKEENSCEEENTLTIQCRIDKTDWCKCE